MTILYCHSTSTSSSSKNRSINTRNQHDLSNYSSIFFVQIIKHFCFTTNCAGLFGLRGQKSGVSGSVVLEAVSIPSEFLCGLSWSVSLLSFNYSRVTLS